MEARSDTRALPSPCSIVLGGRRERGRVRRGRPVRTPILRGTRRVVGESPPPASAGTGTDAQACVRLATATETELQTLPGVGPALAQRIISYRATHPRLTSVEELDDVPGIGPSLIEKIRPGVC